MSWIDNLNEDPIPWLLEDDQANPGVRYFTLVDILEKPRSDPDVVAAKKDVMKTGPVPMILTAQHPDGYWVEPGAGYYPKYRGTVWQVIFLAQFGGEGDNPKVKLACEYILSHSRSRLGGFSATATPGGMVHCLQGNLGAALIDLGCFDDDRVREALHWLARSITGEGISSFEDKNAPLRYLKSANCGPGFLCSANNRLPCAWGAVKAMLALSKVPQSERTEMMKAAIQVGVDFLLGNDPSVADYPMGYSKKPNLSWFKFGYPIGYVTDVLQNLEVLVLLGYGKDNRLTAALDLLRDKQNAQGRWLMEYTYNGKTWADVEQKGGESKWVTLRALRVLKGAS